MYTPHSYYEAAASSPAPRNASSSGFGHTPPAVATLGAAAADGYLSPMSAFNPNAAQRAAAASAFLNSSSGGPLSPITHSPTSFSAIDGSSRKHDASHTATRAISRGNYRATGGLLGDGAQQHDAQYTYSQALASPASPLRHHSSTSAAERVAEVLSSPQLPTGHLPRYYKQHVYSVGLGDQKQQQQLVSAMTGSHHGASASFANAPPTPHISNSTPSLYDARRLDDLIRSNRRLIREGEVGETRGGELQRAFSPLGPVKLRGGEVGVAPSPNPSRRLIEATSVPSPLGQFRPLDPSPEFTYLRERVASLEHHLRYARGEKKFYNHRGEALVSAEAVFAAGAYQQYLSLGLMRQYFRKWLLYFRVLRRANTVATGGDRSALQSGAGGTASGFSMVVGAPLNPAAEGRKESVRWGGGGSSASTVVVTPSSPVVAQPSSPFQSEARRVYADLGIPAHVVNYSQPPLPPPSVDPMLAAAAVRGGPARLERAVALAKAASHHNANPANSMSVVTAGQSDYAPPPYSAHPIMALQQSPQHQSGGGSFRNEGGGGELVTHSEAMVFQSWGSDKRPRAASPIARHSHQIVPPTAVSVPIGTGAVMATPNLNQHQRQPMSAYVMGGSGGLVDTPQSEVFSPHAHQQHHHHHYQLQHQPQRTVAPHPTAATALMDAATADEIRFYNEIEALHSQVRTLTLGAAQAEGAAYAAALSAAAAADADAAAVEALAQRVDGIDALLEGQRRLAADLRRRQDEALAKMEADRAAAEAAYAEERRRIADRSASLERRTAEVEAEQSRAAAARVELVEALAAQESAAARRGLEAVRHGLGVLTDAEASTRLALAGAESAARAQHKSALAFALSEAAEEASAEAARQRDADVHHRRFTALQERSVDSLLNAAALLVQQCEAAEAHVRRIVDAEAFDFLDTLRAFEAQTRQILELSARGLSSAATTRGPSPRDGDGGNEVHDASSSPQSYTTAPPPHASPSPLPAHNAPVVYDRKSYDSVSAVASGDPSEITAPHATPSRSSASPAPASPLAGNGRGLVHSAVPILSQPLSQPSVDAHASASPLRLNVALADLVATPGRTGRAAFL